MKERIKRVMNYKKLAFWIIIAAAALCIVIAMCFLTDPIIGNFGVLPDIHSHGYVVEEVTYKGGMYSFSVTAVENSLIYSICADMQLSSQKEHSEEGTWTQLSKLEETKLTNAFDSETFESIEHWVPSGLEPQTYLFQNADPSKSYIVVAAFSTEADAPVYIFGARFDAQPYDNFDSGPIKTIDGNLRTYYQNGDGRKQPKDRCVSWRAEYLSILQAAAWACWP